MDKHFTFLASAKELKHSELYMTVKCVMFTADTANLNGVRCTEDFLDSIITHADEYVCLPLYADVDALKMRRFSSLGHRYNEREDKFYTQSIGSFYSFEKENLPSGEVALIGCARILKRDAEVCKAIAELFATNKLFFSFEIAVGSYRTREEDGTMEIYASSDNVLEGMCVVTNPAYPQAEALELCAEKQKETKEGEQDVDSENEEMKVVAETNDELDVSVQETVATETETAEVAEIAEAKTEEAKAEEAKAEEVETEEAKAEEVKAEVEEVEAAKCEDDDDDKKKAEDEECAEAKTENEVVSETSKALEELASTMKAVIATIENLGREVASVKEQLETKQTTVTSSANPFMGDISLPDKAKHYSLLDSETPTPADHYSLLEN